jgi:hypothetical protein
MSPTLHLLITKQDNSGSFLFYFNSYPREKVFINILEPLIDVKNPITLKVSILVTESENDYTITLTETAN